MRETGFLGDRVRVRADGIVFLLSPSLYALEGLTETRSSQSGPPVTPGHIDKLHHARLMVDANISVALGTSLVWSKSTQRARSAKVGTSLREC